MSGVFPIPERLPVRINPCPVVEAIFEIRFNSTVPWINMPGMLFAKIKDRYPLQKQLPLAQVPEELRRAPHLANLPLVQYMSDKFLVQTGPRIVGLATKANEYPGWSAIATELQWLIDRMKEAEIVSEIERIGVRYIDFFKGDLFDHLLLSVRVQDKVLGGHDCNFATVLRDDKLTVRLSVANSAIVEFNGVPQTGSVLDVDAWFGALDSDVFENGLLRFEEAHKKIKELFFGLLKPDFLATLNPVYE